MSDEKVIEELRISLKEMEQRLDAKLDRMHAQAMKASVNSVNVLLAGISVVLEKGGHQEASEAVINMIQDRMQHQIGPELAGSEENR